MSTSADDNNKALLSVLDQLFAKYFEEKENFGREKTPQDKFWGTYLRAMQDEDEARPKDWDGNTGSILTFTGLFAATVAAFVIESYKSLSRDSGDQTVVLLGQILAATMNSSSDSTSPAASTEAFQAPLPIVLANALWFISLVVALACALLATLVQQWSRDYVRDIKTRDTLDEIFASRALNHVYIRMGVDRYGMDGVVNLLVALVHLAVILFAAGLLLFLFPINNVVSWCTMAALAVFGLTYLIAGILPIFDTSCPYRTPLTYPLSLTYVVFKVAFYKRIRSLVSKIPFKRVPHWPLQRYRNLVAGYIRSSRTIVGVGDHLEYGDDYRRDRPRVLNRITQKIAVINNTVSPVLVYARRVRELCSKTSTWIWRHLKLVVTLGSHEMSTRSKRRVPRSIWEFASVPRFLFIWKHTRRQMLFGDNILQKTLLLSTLDILQSMEFGDRSTAMDHLLNDDGLLWRLHQLLEEPDSGARVATLKMTYVLMKGCYMREDVWQSSGFHHQITMWHLIWTLFSYKNSNNSLAIHTDIAFLQPAFLSLFHLRWFLLLQTRQVISSTDSEFSLPDFILWYFSESSASEGGRWKLLYDHPMLEHPRGLLLLLNSRLYDPLQSYIPLHLHDADSGKNTMSCLIPLHDDSCCRMTDGPLEHVAACTVLTMVAYLVRAPDADRDKLNDDELYRYGSLWDHDSSFKSWETIFEMNDEDHRRAPSQEFLSILHDAGLEEWRTSGGNLAYQPPLDTPLGRFLNEFADMNSIESPFTTFADVLRNLTKHVDMSLVTWDLAESFQWLYHLQGDSLYAVPHDEGHPQPSPVAMASTATPYVSRVAESDALHAPQRGSSFELERVVIDTAVGIVASPPPSGHGALISGRPGAYVSDSPGYNANHGREDNENGAYKYPGGKAAASESHDMGEAVDIHAEHVKADLRENAPSESSARMNDGKGNAPGDEARRGLVISPEIVDSAKGKIDKEVEGDGSE